MAVSQISTSVTIIDSLLGFQAVSLTAYDTASVPTIAAGSKVEVAGAFFTFSSDESIGSTSWTAISTGDTAYITLTPSGTAGSQILTAAWTSTAPTWSTSKQGYYASASSSVRVIGGCIKDGTSGSEYQGKFIYPSLQNEFLIPVLRTKVVDLGDWDMDATASISVIHGISDFTKIRSISVLIRSDSGSSLTDLNQPDTTTGVPIGGIGQAVSAFITLRRLASGYFDSTNFNTTSYNRGWCTITYEA